MTYPLALALLPWLVVGLPAATEVGVPTKSEQDLRSISTSQLENRLAEIDTQLLNLASYSLRGGVGAIGYRSYWDSSTQWIEIELDRAYPIDEIVLVPCVSRHPSKGFAADAFPRSVRVLSGVNPKTKGTLIAEHKSLDGTAQGIGPLVLPTAGLMASWIRIEATELGERNFDGHQILELSEVMVFSGAENVALRRPVTCSSSDRRSLTGAWHENFLVDGFTPYLMDSAKGAGSNAYIGTRSDESSLTLDLGSPTLISRIHLHAVEQGDTVPQAYSGDLGIPERLRIEGSNAADFSSKVELLDYRRESINDTGPIIILRIPETLCRYIRFTPQDVMDPLLQPEYRRRIGFSEIEVFSHGPNLAIGKQVVSSGLIHGQRTLAALTDGQNQYGEILPLREWMNELYTRGTLEFERPKLVAELDLRHARQRVLVSRLWQLVTLLVVIIGFTILIDRHIRLRKVTQLRERIAADLHDDLGANIHTIGLISDMAKNSLDSREELIELLDHIRDFTEKSGEAARYCTNILEARGVCEDLVDEMNQFSSRILADMEHVTSFEGESSLQKLDQHVRIDLLLFYKECLTNILRHSRATKVSTHVSANGKAVSMTVTDNGIGLDETAEGRIPGSLIRRARLLRAKLETRRPADGGTQIILLLKSGKFRILR